MDKFENLRNKYDTFTYERYEIIEKENNYEIIYYFNIKNLVTFKPILIIPKKRTDIDEDFLEYLVFHIGLIELISYYKCTCSKNIIIKAGYLNEDQINWFKKLIYNGLSEFLYKNNINVTQDELLNIKTNNQKYEPHIKYKGNGNLIPVGGGKDSNVTLELLKGQDNTCFIINPKQTTLECCKIAGYSTNKIIKVTRILDKQIIELNNQGFLNGHTPFSALVAFISYLEAYLNNKKYIILSNEDSANESTVIGTNVNHQYSKTYEFENDFNNYTKKYFKIDIKYFSLLRPLKEYQIGMLFSKMKQYHQTFKSCNLGSKNNNWNWCCECPKCLFVYIILSPFLYKEDLINIFGIDLYEKKELLPIFKELLGYAKTKPFECVGTYEETRIAVSTLIQKLDNLPYLLKYYKENYPLELKDITKYYNKNNNLDKKFEKIIKDAINNV
ncbi:MAG: hypothetical protein J6D28_00855 [Bacilli bacterium]|nr:hypothetical protein [Bacilli bacterium]